VIQRLAFLFLPLLVGVPVFLALGYHGQDLLNPPRTLWIAIQAATRSGGASGPGWVQLLSQG
ncbi:MAG TPA: hypothetical protein VN972_02885, partial [Methylomirabilota bacterium]|nr:hypothetical protein [Methylomirabilota bacterium]